MGWFSNDKKNEKNDSSNIQNSVPTLPRLPELPRINFNLDEAQDATEPLPKLPSFPSSSFGKKLSQDTIKEAVSGRKEVMEDDEADELDLDQRMQRPLRKPNAMESDDEEIESERIPFGFREAAKKVRQAEPVFVRIDKFEEGLKIFEETKVKLAEIESMLREVKQIKVKEEKELFDWESEIQSIKRDMEKIDQDIFSKVE